MEGRPVYDAYNLLPIKYDENKGIYFAEKSSWIIIRKYWHDKFGEAKKAQP